MFLDKAGIPFLFQTTDDSEFLADLYQFCLKKEQEVLELPRTWNSEARSATSARYGSYNFLTFPHPAVKRVWDLIKAAYSELSARQGLEPESLWIQSWMNLHRKDQHLDIHRHLGFRAHGHFSVNVSGTSTIYEIGDEDFEVSNENGMLTLIGCDDVWHRVTPYPGDDVRVSIAFDLLRTSDIELANARTFIPFC